MDNRRLSTGDVLAAGIINMPMPDTNIPKDRQRVDGGDDDDDKYVGDATVIEALEAGKLIQSANYYGVPHVWKVSDGVYRGVLLQYRAVTEDVTFATAAFAAAWFGEKHNATWG